MSEQIKHQWRVTKFNPSYRNDYGQYTLNEWTCLSEIGKTFQGKIFTLVDYLQVEEAYVNSVMKFMEDSGITTLRVMQLSTDWIDKESTLYDSVFDQLELKEDMQVNEGQIRLICKMFLRGLLNCHLYKKDTFFINFGWDYYMYIGSSTNCLSAVQFAKNNGLFPEQMKSPYYLIEEEITRFLQWNVLSNEEKLVVGEEELVGIHLDSLRKMFLLSPEHPVIGAFEVTEEQREFFQQYVTHKIDFTKYEYSFWGGS